MKTKHAGLTLAMTAIMSSATPAIAGGDVIYTGVKDPYAAAVPVPAPVPVPVYEPEYYVRFDTGAAWISNGTLEEIGTPMTMRAITDIEPLEFGSIGAGKYITPRIRAELAVDLFTRAQVDRGDETFIQPIVFPDPGVGADDQAEYSVTRQEEIEFEQDTIMLNFYYDFRNATRFTPYLGAGIGVTYRQLTRTSSETANCDSLTNPNDPTRDCDDAPFADPAEITEGTSTEKRWDLAGALMAGVAIQVTEDILWDTGYRYMWQNGSISVDSLTLAGTSRVEIKDVGQHQLRTGIRLNLN
jgi:opacity protein-like surface antigen